MKSINEIVKGCSWFKIFLRSKAIYVKFKECRAPSIYDSNIETQIQSAISELVLNAGKAIFNVEDMDDLIELISTIKEKRGDITVSTELSHGKIVFKIRDTGVGIPREHLDMVLSGKWSRRKRHSVGGFGLNGAVQALSEAAGAQNFQISSEFGKWTEISFELPTLSILLSDPLKLVEIIPTEKGNFTRTNIKRLDCLLNTDAKLKSFTERLSSGNAKLLDAGSGTGECLAYFSTYPVLVYGIEYSQKLVHESFKLLQDLDNKNLIDKARIKQVQGDFTEDKTYKKLGIAFCDIDLFYLYWDRSCGAAKLANKIREKSKKSTMLLLLTGDNKPPQTELRVLARVNNPADPTNDTFWLFIKD